MKKSLVRAAGIAAALTCTVAAGAPALAAAPTTPVVRAGAATAPGTSSQSLDPQVRARLDALRAALPDGWQATVAAAQARLGDSEWRDVRDQAVAAGDKQCRPGALSLYAAQQVAGVDRDLLQGLAAMGVLDMPATYALLHETDEQPQYFGPDGDKTIQLTHELRDLKRFWDVDTDDVQLVAMHSDFFDHRDQVVSIVPVFFNISPDDPVVGMIADELISLVRLSGLAGSPLLTLNAFAFSAQGAPGVDIPDKVVIGDGMLQALDAVGLGDMAPRAILAHEFAHQVQYEDGLFASALPAPEATRRTELMADAFGTFSLTHKRGAALNAKRLLATEQSFYAMGDCATTSTDHHGTPDQRLRAATWGARVAASQQKQGHIMPSLTLDALFERELPEIVAPDAG